MVVMIIVNFILFKIVFLMATERYGNFPRKPVNFTEGPLA
jgi:hypothetical protein